MNRREFIAAGAGAAAVAMSAGMMSGCTTGAACACKKGKVMKVCNKDFYKGGTFDAFGVNKGGTFDGVSDDFGAEDAGGLGVGFGVMVEDACDADKEFAEGIEGFIGEAVAVAVDFVIAEDEVKEVDLVEGVIAAGKGIECGEQIRVVHRKPPIEEVPAAD